MPAERPPKRASRIPEDFALTPERRGYAAAEGLDPERTHARFLDYWRAAAGSRARKHDWDATWRNWCRTEADRARPPAPSHPRGSTSGKLSTLDRVRNATGGRRV